MVGTWSSVRGRQGTDVSGGGAMHSGSMPHSWPLVTKKGPAASASAHTANNLTPGGWLTVTFHGSREALKTRPLIGQGRMAGASDWLTLSDIEKGN